GGKRGIASLDPAIADGRGARRDRRRAAALLRGRRRPAARTDNTAGERTWGRVLGHRAPRSAPCGLRARGDRLDPSPVRRESARARRCRSSTVKARRRRIEPATFGPAIRAPGGRPEKITISQPEADRWVLPPGLSGAASPVSICDLAAGGEA